MRIADLGRDVRVAVRSLGKARLFAVVTTLTLCLGIGATSAIFALVNAVVLRPLPFPAGDRLVQFAASVSPPDFFDTKEQARAFADLAAYWSSTTTLSPAGGRPSRIPVAFTSANLLPVLGASPAIGRGFAAADAEPGAGTVALISHGLWQREFGGDTAIVGRSVTVDDLPATVIGVMPAAFSFPVSGADLWLPLRLSRTQPPNRAIPAERYRQYRILTVVGRLADGLSLTQANAELTSVAASLQRLHPDQTRRLTLRAVTLHDATVGDVRPAMLLLLGAVACLLLIATANIATLMAVRTAARERDFALQLALGARRGHLVQQTLVESVLIGFAGGATGLALAAVFLRLMIRFAPAGIPRLSSAAIDGRVVLFTFVVATVAGLLFGAAPALRLARGALIDPLKGRGSSTTSQRRVRGVFVVAEIALSMLLLVTAGLLAQTFARLSRVELGFRSGNVFMIDRLDTPRAPAATTASLYDELLRRLRDSPGVDAAATTMAVPLDPRARFFIDDTPFTIDGRPIPSPDERPTARIQVISDGYFGTMGVPVVEGRSFDARDRGTGDPVAIVNATLAKAQFPNGDAVGQYVTHELAIVPGQPTRRRIVGVVGDVRQFRLDEPFEPQLFVPHAQMPWPSMAIVVKSSLTTDRLAPLVRNAVWSLDPGLPVPAPVALSHSADQALGQPRLRAWLIALFAGTALLLAAIGLYGTIALNVQQRRSEIAMRLVLGATRGDVSALVMRDGLILTALGGVLGLAAAFAVTRAIASLLFGVGTFDSATVAAVSALVLVVSAAACYLPARRVSNIDPIAAIRE